MNLLAGIFILLWSFPTAAFAEESGLKTVVAADLVARINLGESEAQDRLELRGAELGLYGPIDHTFDGQLSLASHPSKEGPGLELHEAFITAPRLSIPVQMKIGQFFLGVGRLNQTHQHERPFVTTPFIHELVFDDDEGAKDTGVELKYLTQWATPLEISLGITNGWTFGHSHTQGSKPRDPLLYGRVTLFGDASLLNFEHASSGALLGFSYLRRRPDRSEPSFNLYGVDLTIKKRQEKSIALLWQTEVWVRELFKSGSPKENIFGGYSFIEHHIWDRGFIGGRIEGLQSIGQKDLLGRDEKNQRLGFAPTFSWRHSEFQVFRVEYLLSQTTQESDKSIEQSFNLQTNFIMGAHPAHDF